MLQAGSSLNRSRETPAEGEASSARPASLPFSVRRSCNFESPPLILCGPVEAKETAAAVWRPDWFAITSRQLPSQIIATLGSHFHRDCSLLTAQTLRARGRERDAPAAASALINHTSLGIIHKARCTCCLLSFFLSLYVSEIVLCYPGWP